MYKKTLIPTFYTFEFYKKCTYQMDDCQILCRIKEGGNICNSDLNNLKNHVL